MNETSFDNRAHLLGEDTGVMAKDHRGSMIAADPEHRRKVIAICHALPEVTVEEQQHVTFRVRGKTFAYYLDDHHGDGRVALNCKAAPNENQELVASEPERFFIPAYLGSRGWVGLYLDLPSVDWDEVSELVRESYVLIAPKRLGRMVADQ
jgi:predicted DNA-binding protein (MmcQ/YjbR family)